MPDDLLKKLPKFGKINLKLTQFYFSELSESEFSGDHFNSSSRTATRHLNQFLKRDETITDLSVTLDDSFGLK